MLYAVKTNDIFLKKENIIIEVRGKYIHQNIISDKVYSKYYYY